MRWFGQPADPEAEADQKLIEQGGLPRAASARLEDAATRFGTDEHFFSSNMSVNEFLLTHECGYEPLTQVMGTSVYHLGWQYYPGQNWGYVDPLTLLPPSQELGVLTEANYEARRLTFGRLLKEAALLNADGVVGVRFARITNFLTPGMVEFRAFGTAVRMKGAPPRTGSSGPFLSNLSGQDHWALRKAGYRPLGFVFGNCSWYQVSGWRNQSLNNSWLGSMANGEYPDFTRGFYQARELAAARLEHEARGIRAIGVVGVTVEPEIEVVEGGRDNAARRDLLAQFTMFGTAIGYDDSPINHSGPGMTIDLRG